MNSISNEGALQIGTHTNYTFNNDMFKFWLFYAYSCAILKMSLTLPYFWPIAEVQTMTLFSKWIELIITQDSGYFAKVTALLKDNGIEYRDEIQNIGHANR